MVKDNKKEKRLHHMIEYFEGTNPDLGLTVKATDIYHLYTRVVREYLGARHMDMAPSNVLISGVETHVKVTDGKKFYSIRIERGHMSSLDKNFGEFDYKLSLMVIEFNDIRQDWYGDGNGKMVYIETFYQLGNLLYKKDMAQKLNNEIHRKRLERSENKSLYNYTMTVDNVGKLNRKGFKRGINTLKAYVDLYGNKRLSITNSITGNKQYLN